MFSLVENQGYGDVMKDARCFHSYLVVFAFVVLLPTQLSADTISVPVRTGLNAVIFVPPTCEPSPLLPQAQDNRGCFFVADDGGTRTISLVAGSMALGQFMEDFFHANREEYFLNPNGYLRGLLIAMEESATSIEPAPGQTLLTAEASIQPNSENPSGLDECLVFNFDYTAELDQGDVRLDGTGVRCLGYDEGVDQVYYVYLKYGNGHNDVEMRARNFELEATALIESLRLE